MYKHIMKALMVGFATVGFINVVSVLASPVDVPIFLVVVYVVGFLTGALGYSLTAKR